MAKGIGLIGNFKGKVGNMVGYKLTDSNSGNTQGIRVYQPIVKNPKTAAQAEQRAKLAPINATYRALKMVIDRGNEGLPYGNKSRLAWLKNAFKASQMVWIEKSKPVTEVLLCQLTKGSIVTSLSPEGGESFLTLSVAGVAAATTTTIGLLSTALLAQFTGLKNGDQLTFVATIGINNGLQSVIESIVLDTTSNVAIPSFITVEDGTVLFMSSFSQTAFAVIVSREGTNGEHLRSNSFLMMSGDYDVTVLNDTAKTAAIESYMSSAAVNADWAEESIQ